MEVKPGYKQTEVGVVPDDWDVADLGQLCTKIQDGTHFSPKIRGGEYLYVTSKNIGFGFLNVIDAPRIDDAQHREIYRRCDVAKGDVLLTKDGANTGNAALNTIDEEFSLLSSVAMLRFDEKQHCPTFFLQQILSRDGQRRIKDAMSGNAITRLTLAKIKQLRFPFCKVPEQRGIAEALSDVDLLLEGLDRLIAKRRHLKQAAMQQLLTGQTRLPGFHGEWDVKPFAAVLVRLNAKAYQIQTCDYQATGKYPVVDQGKEPVVGFSDREEKCLRCPDGGVIVFGDHTCFVKFIDFDFLVGADGTQILQGKMRQSTRFHALQLQHRGVEPTGYNRHFKLLRERDFLVPPHTEQVAIASVLSDMDAELSALEARRAKIRDLKQAMMQELLTGKTRLV